MTEPKLDGLISFFASHYAIRAETVLKRDGIVTQLVAGPKDLSPNCGVALRFEYAQREIVVATLASRKVQIETVHYYVPRSDDWRTRCG
jgi:hypothetical protein